MKTFQKPLTAAEERLCLRRCQEGDPEAKRILIERNLRLVAHVAKKYTNYQKDSDELISIGTVGLIKGISTYKNTKGSRLATYTARCIDNEILMYLRKSNRQKAEVSIDEPLKADWDGNELLLSDVLSSEDDLVSRDIEDESDMETLYAALSKLSPRERKIMDLRFGFSGGEELTQKEVADMLGISQSYISRLEKRIIGRLRKELVKSGM